MLTFELYKSGITAVKSTVTIMPALVESVVETELRSGPVGWDCVALITMASGQQFTVVDYNRSVVRKISEAQEVTK